jgi:hypothetical protein
MGSPGWLEQGQSSNKQSLMEANCKGLAPPILTIKFNNMKKCPKGSLLGRPFCARLTHIREMLEGAT